MIIVIEYATKKPIEIDEKDIELVTDGYDSDKNARKPWCDITVTEPKGHSKVIRAACSAKKVGAMIIEARHIK